MHTLRLLLLGATLWSLGACTVIQGHTPALFDLGLHQAVATGDQLAGRSISVAEVNVPAWLDAEHMYYRLDYAQRQQPHPYATSRWTMTPGQLLAERVAQRIVQAGGIALSETEGRAQAPTLRIRLDDFSQHFAGPAASTGRIALRATLFEDRQVIGQRTFVQEANAPTADAAGGAHALAEATEAALTELIAWLARSPGN